MLTNIHNVTVEENFWNDHDSAMTESYRMANTYFISRWTCAELCNIVHPKEQLTMFLCVITIVYA